MSSSTLAEHDSRLDRVRAQVTRLMHLTRERTAALGAPPGEASASPAAFRQEPAVPALSGLADSLRALQATMQEADRLIREGWDLAVDLNEMRRTCCCCERSGAFCEAIGCYQGLLNRWRHNEQAATRAIGLMLRLTSSIDLHTPGGAARQDHELAAAAR